MLDELLLSNGLGRVDIREAIPTNVRHVMRIVQLLGYRYLWVDALCILQDDEAAKQSDIGNMAAIYATAVATIIAGDGDADDGILGLRGVSPPRSIRQQVFPLGTARVIETSSSRAETLVPESYSSRGWVFQARAVSRQHVGERLIGGP